MRRMKIQAFLSGINLIIVKILTTEWFYTKIFQMNKPKNCHLSYRNKAAIHDPGDVIVENIIKNGRDL